jgi:hypothetical protein
MTLAARPSTTQDLNGVGAASRSASSSTSHSLNLSNEHTQEHARAGVRRGLAHAAEPRRWRERDNQGPISTTRRRLLITYTYTDHDGRY